MSNLNIQFLFLKYSILLLTIFFISSCTKKALLNSSDSTKKEFKNQGDQENYWIENLFTQDYKVQSYKRYNGLIIFNDNVYKYNNAIVEISSVPALEKILKEGLFYPDIITQSLKYQPRIHIKINKDSLLAWRKRSTTIIRENRHDMLNVDSLRISNFEEIKFAETTRIKRRFRFWLFRKGFANPTVCLMELTNKNTFYDMPLLTFINGAKLTYFYHGWIII